METGEALKGVNPRVGTDPDRTTFFLGMNRRKIGFMFTVTCASSAPPPDEEDEEDEEDDEEEEDEEEEDDDEGKEEMGTEETEGWEMSFGEGG